MQRDPRPAYQPFLAEEDGRYFVKLKSAPGEYHVLSTPISLPAVAKQDLKRIRREMFQTWDFQQRQRRELGGVPVARTALLASLRAILPYAESRAEDMLEADGEADGCDPSPETVRAISAVDAAKALLASLEEPAYG